VAAGLTIWQVSSSEAQTSFGRDHPFSSHITGRRLASILREAPNRFLSYALSCSAISIFAQGPPNGHEQQWVQSLPDQNTAMVS
jgi:hypothetical protein